MHRQVLNSLPPFLFNLVTSTYLLTHYVWGPYSSFSLFVNISFATLILPMSLLCPIIASVK